MNHTHLFRMALKERVATGKVTADDLTQIATVAKKHGRNEDRALYARAKQVFGEQEETFQTGAKQILATLEKAENGTESVDEMRALLQKVEKMTQGKDDAQSQQMLTDTRKRYAITRILNDLPAEETADEKTE